MKKGLALLALVIAVLISACSKETSVEKATQQNQLNTWSFSVGSTQYSGTIDTSFVEDFSVFQFVNVEGFTPVNNGQWFVSFGGTSLQVGEYVFPFANFAYAENGEFVFETNPTTTDFRMVITELTADRAVGTFSGTVVESATGNPIVISNGRFATTR
ncbi:hypothetical protein [Flavihumibacter cheonanensis]|jgi:hypothetical protein|uniref:hypothetical protein n=1 Tax=Flavihumibacter cheonanensis TaxID=1442385 RepID=UPI001EF7F221|nr:hypothetical protein [Flavihumibacter cheonanensis]MCG7754104.1 hypothetical protein [Flavihumibacter cheonanensis]